jgi:hypothetical protein
MLAGWWTALGESAQRNAAGVSLYLLMSCCYHWVLTSRASTVAFLLPAFKLLTISSCRMARPAASVPRGELSPEIKSFPDFFQDPPRLGNAFADDSYLQAILQRVMKENYAKVKPDLLKFGRSVECSKDEMPRAVAFSCRVPFASLHISPLISPFMSFSRSAGAPRA